MSHSGPDAGPGVSDFCTKVLTFSQGVPQFPGGLRVESEKGRLDGAPPVKITNHDP